MVISGKHGKDINDYKHSLFDKLENDYQDCNQSNQSDAVIMESLKTLTSRILFSSKLGRPTRITQYQLTKLFPPLE